MKVCREIQTLKLLLEQFNIFAIYLSSPCWKRRENYKVSVHVRKKTDVLLRRRLTELQDVSASDIHVSKGVRPQQAVGASL